METSASKCRNAKKRTSASIELYTSLSSKYRHVENILCHTLARNWLRYEFEYNEIELAYFTKNKTFESILSHEFPHLKCRNLTMAEWRTIRKYCVQRKIRRFSSTFVQQQRIDLEKYRRYYNLLRKNKRDEQLAELNEKTMAEYEEENSACNEQQNQLEVCHLIVEARKLIESNSVIVAELREMNDAKSEKRFSNDDTMNAQTAVRKICGHNEKIREILEQMLHFQIVKDALLFDAIDKKKLFLPLSPEYFHRKCELRIYEDWRIFRLDTFIKSDDVRNLVDILLEFILCIFEHEQIAAIDYQKTVLNKYTNMLKTLLEADDFDYFNETIAPLYLVIAAKLST